MCLNSLVNSDGNPDGCVVKFNRPIRQRIITQIKFGNLNWVKKNFCNCCKNKRKILLKSLKDNGASLALDKSSSIAKLFKRNTGEMMGVESSTSKLTYNPLSVVDSMFNLSITAE